MTVTLSSAQLYSDNSYSVTDSSGNTSYYSEYGAQLTVATGASPAGTPLGASGGNFSFTDPATQASILINISANLGRVTTINAPTGTKTVASFTPTTDASGNLTGSKTVSVTFAPNGAPAGPATVTTVSYVADGSGKDMVTTLNNGAGEVVTTTTAPSGSLRSSSWTQRDASGNLLAAGSSSYDASGNLTSSNKTDASGNLTKSTFTTSGTTETTTTVTLNNAGKQTSSVISVTSTSNGSTTTTVTSTDASGNSVIDTYDQNGNLTSSVQKNAGGGTSSASLDGSGNVVFTNNGKTYTSGTTAGVDASGNTTTTVTDAAGDQTVTVKSSSGAILSITTTDSSGNKVTTIYDGSGNALVTRYDASGHQISQSGTSSVLDASGHTVLSQSDGLGDGLVTIEDASGHVLSVTKTVEQGLGNGIAKIVSTTTYTYPQDASGNITSTTPSSTTKIRTAYDSTGKLVGSPVSSSITSDSSGNTVTTTSDGKGDILTQVVNSAGTLIKTTTINANGTLNTIYNANGTTWNVFTDPKGNTRQYGESIVQDASGNRTDTKIDPSGNELITHTDASGNKVVTQISAAGAKTVTSTSADGSSVAVTQYDASGNLLGQSKTTTVTDKTTGNITTTVNDGKGNITSTVTTSGGTLISTTQSYTDASGYLHADKTLANGATSDSISDASGHLLSKTRATPNADGSTTVTVSNGQNVQTSSITYGTNGQVLSSTDASGNVTRYTYNSDGTSGYTITTSSGSVTSYGTTESTDSSGNLITRTVNSDGSTTVNKTDSSGNWISSTLTYTDSSGNLVIDKSDASGNFSEVIENPTTTAVLSQTTSHTDVSGNVTTTYMVNNNGSSSTTSQTVDPQGQLISSTDASGNVIHVTYNPDGSSYTTEVSSTGQLLASYGESVTTNKSTGQVTTILTDVSGNSSTTVVDASGNLVSQTDTTKNPDGSITTNTSLPDGSYTSQTKNASGIILESSSSRPLANSNGEWQTITTDASGNQTTTLTNAQGGVVSNIYFDKSTGETVTSNPDPNSPDTLDYQVSGNGSTQNFTLTQTADASGNSVTIESDASGNQTVTTRDPNGNLLQSVDISARDLATGDYTVTTQLANGDVTSFTSTSIDASGNNTGTILQQSSYLTDAAGNTTSSYQDSNGNGSVVESNSQGSVIYSQSVSIDGSGNQTTTTQYAAGNPNAPQESATIGSSSEQGALLYQYQLKDASGNVLALESTFQDASGNQIIQYSDTQYPNGNLPQLGMILQPGDNGTLVLDVSGNFIKSHTVQLDSSGNTVTADQLANGTGTTVVTSPSGQSISTTTLTLDPSGNLVESVTDASGNVTTSAGSLTTTSTTTDSNGDTIKTVSDVSGNLTVTIYDPSGKLLGSSQTLQNSSQQGESGTLTQNYDASGNLTGSIFSYTDASGNQHTTTSTLVDSGAHTDTQLEVTDPSGNLLSSALVTWDQPATGQVTQIIEDAQGNRSSTVGTGVDTSGNLTGVLSSASEQINSQSGTITDTYSDSSGNSNVQVSSSDGNFISSSNTQVDSSGMVNIFNSDASGNVSSFTYQNLNDASGNPALNINGTVNSAAPGLVAYGEATTQANGDFIYTYSDGKGDSGTSTVTPDGKVLNGTDTQVDPNNGHVTIIKIDGSGNTSSYTYDNSTDASGNPAATAGQGQSVPGLIGGTVTVQLSNGDTQTTFTDASGNQVVNVSTADGTYVSSTSTSLDPTTGLHTRIYQDDQGTFSSYTGTGMDSSGNITGVTRSQVTQLETVANAVSLNDPSGNFVGDYQTVLFDVSGNRNGVSYSTPSGALLYSKDTHTDASNNTVTTVWQDNGAGYVTTFTQPGAGSPFETQTYVVDPNTGDVTFTMTDSSGNTSLRIADAADNQIYSASTTVDPSTGQATVNTSNDQGVSTSTTYANLSDASGNPGVGAPGFISGSEQVADASGNQLLASFTSLDPSGNYLTGFSDSGYAGAIDVAPGTQLAVVPHSFGSLLYGADAQLIFEFTSLTDASGNPLSSTNAFSDASGNLVTISTYNMADVSGNVTASNSIKDLSGNPLFSATSTIDASGNYAVNYVDTAYTGLISDPLSPSLSKPLFGTTGSSGTVVYDPSGNLLSNSSVDASGNITTMINYPNTPDVSGNVVGTTTVKDPSGNTIYSSTYSVDASGNYVSQFTDTAYTGFIDAGRAVGVQSGPGISGTNTWDPSGNLISSTRQIVDACGNLIFSSTDQLDASGNYDYQYKDTGYNGNVTLTSTRNQAVAPLVVPVTPNTTGTIVYDASGQILSNTAGSTTTTTDDNGNLIITTNYPVSNLSGAVVGTTRIVDSSGNVLYSDTTTVAPSGNLVSNFSDPGYLGSVLGKTPLLSPGSSGVMTRDSSGNLTSFTASDSYGDKTALTINPAAQSGSVYSTTTVDSSGNATLLSSTTIDSSGNYLTTYSDSGFYGNAQIQVSPSLGFYAPYIDPYHNSKVSITYDQNGNLTNYTANDAAGNVTTLSVIPSAQAGSVYSTTTIDSSGNTSLFSSTTTIDNSGNYVTTYSDPGYFGFAEIQPNPLAGKSPFGFTANANPGASGSFTYDKSGNLLDFIMSGSQGNSTNIINNPAASIDGLYSTTTIDSSGNTSLFSSTTTIDNSGNYVTKFTDSGYSGYASIDEFPVLPDHTNVVAQASSIYVTPNSTGILTKDPSGNPLGITVTSTDASTGNTTTEIIEPAAGAGQPYSSTTIDSSANVVLFSASTIVDNSGNYVTAYSDSGINGPVAIQDQPYISYYNTADKLSLISGESGSITYDPIGNMLGLFQKDGSGNTISITTNPNAISGQIFSTTTIDTSGNNLQFTSVTNVDGSGNYITNYSDTGYIGTAIIQPSIGHDGLAGEYAVPGSPGISGNLIYDGTGNLISYSTTTPDGNGNATTLTVNPSTSAGQIFSASTTVDSSANAVLFTSQTVMDGSGNYLTNYTDQGYTGLIKIEATPGLNTGYMANVSAGFSGTIVFDSSGNQLSSTSTPTNGGTTNGYGTTTSTDSYGNVITSSTYNVADVSGNLAGTTTIVDASGHTLFSATSTLDASGNYDTSYSDTGYTGLAIVIPAPYTDQYIYATAGSSGALVYDPSGNLLSNSSVDASGNITTMINYQNTPDVSGNVVGTTTVKDPSGNTIYSSTYSVDASGNYVSQFTDTAYTGFFNAGSSAGMFLTPGNSGELVFDPSGNMLSNTQISVDQSGDKTTSTYFNVPDVSGNQFNSTTVTKQDGSQVFSSTTTIDGSGNYATSSTDSGYGGQVTIQPAPSSPPLPLALANYPNSVESLVYDASGHPISGNLDILDAAGNPLHSKGFAVIQNSIQKSSYDVSGNLVYGTTIQIDSSGNATANHSLGSQSNWSMTEQLTNAYFDFAQIHLNGTLSSDTWNIEAITKLDASGNATFNAHNQFSGQDSWSSNKTVTGSITLTENNVVNSFSSSQVTENPWSNSAGEKGVDRVITDTSSPFANSYFDSWFGAGNSGYAEWDAKTGQYYASWHDANGTVGAVSGISLTDPIASLNHPSKT